MKKVRLSALMILSSIIGIGSPLLGEVKNREPASFQMLTGKVPAWKMKLNHLTESFAHNGTVNRARISEGRTIGFEGFHQRVDPFLNDLGYRFSRFLISYGKGWKAKDDRSYETVLKPLGISYDLLWRPRVRLVS